MERALEGESGVASVPIKADIESAAPAEGDVELFRLAERIRRGEDPASFKADQLRVGLVLLGASRVEDAVSAFRRYMGDDISTKEQVVTEHHADDSDAEDDLDTEVVTIGEGDGHLAPGSDAVGRELEPSVVVASAAEGPGQVKSRVRRPRAAVPPADKTLSPGRTKARAEGRAVSNEEDRGPGMPSKKDAKGSRSTKKDGVRSQKTKETPEKTAGPSAKRKRR